MELRGCRRQKLLAITVKAKKKGGIRCTIPGCMKAFVVSYQNLTSRKYTFFPQQVIRISGELLDTKNL